MNNNNKCINKQFCNDISNIWYLFLLNLQNNDYDSDIMNIIKIYNSIIESVNFFMEKIINKINLFSNTKITYSSLQLLNVSTNIKFNIANHKEILELLKIINQTINDFINDNKIIKLIEKLNNKINTHTLSGGNLSLLENNVSQITNLTSHLTTVYETNKSDKLDKMNDLNDSNDTNVLRVHTPDEIKFNSINQIDINVKQKTNIQKTNIQKMNELDKFNLTLPDIDNEFLKNNNKHISFDSKSINLINNSFIQLEKELNKIKHKLSDIENEKQINYIITNNTQLSFTNDNDKYELIERIDNIKQTITDKQLYKQKYLHIYTNLTNTQYNIRNKLLELENKYYTIFGSDLKFNLNDNISYVIDSLITKYNNQIKQLIDDDIRMINLHNISQNKNIKHNKSNNFLGKFFDIYTDYYICFDGSVTINDASKQVCNNLKRYISELRDLLLNTPLNATENDFDVMITNIKEILKDYLRKDGTTFRNYMRPLLIDLDANKIMKHNDIRKLKSIYQNKIILYEFNTLFNTFMNEYTLLFTNSNDDNKLQNEINNVDNYDLFIETYNNIQTEIINNENELQLIINNNEIYKQSINDIMNKIQIIYNELINKINKLNDTKKYIDNTIQQFNNEYNLNINFIDFNFNDYIQHTTHDTRDNFQLNEPSVSNETNEPNETIELTGNNNEQYNDLTNNIHTHTNKVIKMQHMYQMYIDLTSKVLYENLLLLRHYLYTLNIFESIMKNNYILNIGLTKHMFELRYKKIKNINEIYLQFTKERMINLCKKILTEFNNNVLLINPNDKSFTDLITFMIFTN